jgi:ABC-2 type transport system permease protein
VTATSRGPELLGAWQGGVLLLGCGLPAALPGTLLAVRRDVG